MATSKIEWTEETWNPITGCSKISAGCKNCYAERFAKRLQAMHVDRYKNAFTVTVHRETFDKPLSWKKPRMIFVNSMSDIFHEDICEEDILALFKVMNEANWHTFQVLTKRPERLLRLSKKINWTPNIWMGVSVENKETLNRIDYLKKTDAKVKFVSAEPLLESLSTIDLTGIDWLIVGGESGHNSRPIDKRWVIELRDLAEKTNTAFFFKQWGGINKKKNGSLLEGKHYKEYPQLSSRH